jgi:uncharacterized protein YndB with AHSA1/START domain
MTNEPTQQPPPPIRIERRYEAAVEDLWWLWTTKEGFESWWGPEGFRVEVHKLDLRVGGELVYDMIAVDPQQIAALQKLGMPVTHGTRGTFAEVAPLKRLQIVHLIDFIPGLRPYENRIWVEFFAEANGTRMVTNIQEHQDKEWTRMAVAGFESQLRKVPAVLAARARARKP